MPRCDGPEKEALKWKVGHVNGRSEKEPYAPGSYLHGSFRDGHYQKTRRVSKAQSIIGIVGLVLFFVVLIYVAKFYSLL